MSNHPDGDPQNHIQESERRLQSHGLTTRSLPTLIVPVDARLRHPVDIAKRAIAACLTAARAEGMDADTVSSLATHFELLDVITPSETLVLFSPQPLAPEVAQRFQWRFEACWAMLWILGHVNDLAFPDRTCNPERASALITAAASPTALANGATLRGHERILEEADFTLRLYVICERETESTRRPPGGVLYPVVHQRRASFRWVLLSEAPEWADEPFDP